MFKTVEEYETLFCLAWNLYIAGGDHLVAVKDRPSAAPADGSGSATPAPADKAGKVCGHFKKHGICKFDGDKKCRNGLHPAKFKKSADGSVALPAPAPIIPAVVPLIEIAGADSEDALADADANQWNEILNWDDDCIVSLMIASGVQGGPDRVWGVSHNQVAECSHLALLCPTGFRIVDFVENAGCPLCRGKVDLDCASCDEECSCQRSSADCLPDKFLELNASSEKSDGIADVVDPEWPSDTWKASLDDNGLAMNSISVKTAFVEDVKHFDRICCHLKIDRTVWLSRVKYRVQVVFRWFELEARLCPMGDEALAMRNLEL